MVDANGKQSRAISPVRPIITVSSNTTLGSGHYTVLVNAASAAINITLPTASSHTGRVYNVKKIDATANAVTIIGTIDGVANRTITTQWTDFNFQSNGSAWFMLYGAIDGFRQNN